LIPWKSLTAWRLTLALVLAGTAALPGCTKRDLAKPAAPLTPPARLCAAEGTASSCRNAHEIEQLLAADDLQILGMDDPPGGLQGAKILTLRGSAGGRSVTFRVRWRAQSTADVINEPRKELAAYAVQKLFLNDEELVAPPTAAYCFSLAAYRRFAPDEKATFRGVDCVLGFATYWLEGVKNVSSAREDGWVGNHSDSMLWDPRLFERDPMYRASISKCNLLTHLINHGDAHGGQLLLEQTPRGLRAYVVDNSVAFLSIKNPVMLFREDWSQLLVPSLPPGSIARLQSLGRQDLAQLGVVQELELRDGRLLPRKPASTIAPNDAGAIRWSGTRLRIGLTDSEIDLVSSRIRDLLARPDLAKLTGRVTPG
jgi:hypothetical protein